MKTSLFVATCLLLAFILCAQAQYESYSPSFEAALPLFEDYSFSQSFDNEDFNNSEDLYENHNEYDEANPLFFKKLFKRVSNGVKNVGNKIKNTAKNIGHKIRTTTNKAISGIKKTHNKAVSGFKVVGSKIKKTSTNAWQKVSKFSTKAANSVKKVTVKTVNTVKNAGKKAVDAVKKASVVVASNAKEFFAKKPAIMKKRIVYGLRHENWMAQYWSTIANMKVKDICVAGTHDAGTSAPMTRPAPDIMDQDWKAKLLGFAKPITQAFIKTWSKTQDLSILEQLQLGVRYMDLRFCRDGKNFAICHGLYGHSEHRVFSELRQFLLHHPKEVVMIQLRPFDKDAWHQSDYDRFNKVAAAYVGSLVNHNWDKDSVLQDIVKSGKRLLITHNKKKSNINYNSLPGINFDEFDDHWANKKEANALKNDLKRHVHQSLAQGITKTKIRNLQYLLTPDTETIVKGPLYPSYPKNLQELTRTINHDLDNFITPEIEQFSNILMVDFVEETRAVDIAIAITLARAGQRVPVIMGSQGKKVLTLSTNQLGEYRRFNQLSVPSGFKVALSFNGAAFVTYNAGTYRLPNADVTAVRVYYYGVQML